MSAQNVKIESMFGWVIESFKLVKKNFRGFISACMVTLVLMIFFCAPMMLVMMNTMGDMHARARLAFCRRHDNVFYLLRNHDCR